MKFAYFFLITALLSLLPGCADGPETATATLRTGLSRDQLRARFGEPLRIEGASSGGENWYYNFVSWQSRPTDDSGVPPTTREQASSFSSGLQITKETTELPIYVSADGHVIDPLPAGKIVKN